VTMHSTGVIAVYDAALNQLTLAYKQKKYYILIPCTVTRSASCCVFQNIVTITLRIIFKCKKIDHLSKYAVFFNYTKLSILDRSGFADT